MWSGTMWNLPKCQPAISRAGAGQSMQGGNFAHLVSLVGWIPTCDRRPGGAAPTGGGRSHQNISRYFPQVTEQQLLCLFLKSWRHQLCCLCQNIFLGVRDRVNIEKHISHVKYCLDRKKQARQTSDSERWEECKPKLAGGFSSNSALVSSKTQIYELGFVKVGYGFLKMKRMDGRTAVRHLINVIKM